MTTIEAVAICDSERSGPGANTRLLTIRTRYPKMVHQESLRHRAIYIQDLLGTYLADPDFSLSVSSSRAIPFRKMLEEVRSDELRAAPVFWGSEQKGMSPDAELLGEKLAEAKRIWKSAAEHAAMGAEYLSHTGIHKSIINRLLDPFIHVNDLRTATTPGWMNFFGLRLDKHADEIIRKLAEECWRVWNESRPRKLELGRWHLPYADDDESICEANVFWEQWERREASGYEGSHGDLLRRMSVARCAHLSYESFETGARMTVEKCVELHDRFVGSIPLHASPMEHQATPDELEWLRSAADEAYGGTWLDALINDDNSMWKYGHQAGNLGPGWRQYRKFLTGEAVAPLPEAYR